MRRLPMGLWFSFSARFAVAHSRILSFCIPSFLVVKTGDLHSCACKTKNDDSSEEIVHSTIVDPPANPAY